MDVEMDSRMRNGRELPIYLKAKLHHAVNDVTALAMRKGLDAAFEYELFTLGCCANEAIESGSAALARDILFQARQLRKSLEDMPEKPQRQDDERSSTRITLARKRVA